jgi:hypothetical protein
VPHRVLLILPVSVPHDHHGAAQRGGAGRVTGIAGMLGIARPGGQGEHLLARGLGQHRGIMIGSQLPLVQQPLLVGLTPLGRARVPAQAPQQGGQNLPTHGCGRREECERHKFVTPFGCQRARMLETCCPKSIWVPAPRMPPVIEC